MSTSGLAIRSGIKVDRIEEIEAGEAASAEETWSMGRALDIPIEMLEA